MHTDYFLCYSHNTIFKHIEVILYLTILSVMQPGSSSHSIIYLSPNNSKFPHKQPPRSSLLDDAAPHAENPFDASECVPLTPDKKIRRSARQLEKSSYSQPNSAAFHYYPFAHFENDMGPGILSKGKEEKFEKEEGQNQQEQGTPELTARKPKKFEEMVINTLLASPKKKHASKPKPVKQQPQPSLQEEYRKLLERITIDPRSFVPPQVCFFYGENDQSLSKLLAFDLNSKNGKCVKFDHKTKTCQPFFKCFGCRRSFAVAAALGGHLSKCGKKEKHLMRCKSKEKVKLEESPSQEDEDEEEEVMVKVEQDESSSSRNSRRNFAMKVQKKEAKNRTRISLRIHGRTTMIRMAKARAEQLIHSVIEEHFE